MQMPSFRRFLPNSCYNGFVLTLDARRKFDKALNALPATKRTSPIAAKEGLEYCNKLFAIGRKLKDATPEERYAGRLAQSRPFLDAFLAWLEDQSTKALPKGTFGEAVTYCLNQWSKLKAFPLDGNLEIDNNRSERSVKPFVIGRKNFLFANTPRGATASAIAYSIVETAKENGLNPFAYLQHLFEQLPNVDTDNPDALTALLPWSDLYPPQSTTVDNAIHQQSPPEPQWGFLCYRC